MLAFACGIFFAQSANAQSQNRKVKSSPSVQNNLQVELPKKG